MLVRRTCLVINPWVVLIKSIYRVKSEAYNPESGLYGKVKLRSVLGRVIGKTKINFTAVTQCL